jgi:hypothetical protein
MSHDIVQARCSQATLDQITHIKDNYPGNISQQYIDSLTCSLGSIDPKGYIGTWGPDKGTLFPFDQPTYSDPADNLTGTCYTALTPMDADTWNNLDMNSGNVKMTKNSFCNLATVGAGAGEEKPLLAALSKKLITTAGQIYKKIQDLETETRTYYQQSTTQNVELQNELTMYKYFYNELMLLIQGNAQPGLTLAGQAEDAQIKATSGYYQYRIWSILAALIFFYTIFKIFRMRG